MVNDTVDSGGQCQSCGLIDRHRRDCPYRPRRAKAAAGKPRGACAFCRAPLDRSDALAVLAHNATCEARKKASPESRRADIDREIREAPKDYLLRDIPADIHARATKRAEADGLALRSVLIGLLEAYADRGVEMRLRARKSTPEARPAK